MLDIKFIRENQDIVKEAVRRKKANVDIDKLITLDNERLRLVREIEDMRAKQNLVSKEIAQAKSEERITEMKILKRKLQEKEKQYKEVLERWRHLMLLVPNVPDVSVPEGDDETGNQQLRVWGEKPQFSFTPRPHYEILEDADDVDFERGVKVAGFRGYFLKNKGALLTFALWQYTLKFFMQKGFVPMIAPSLVRRESFLGTGWFPQSEEEVYKTQDELFLSGTAEVSVMGSFMDETLSIKDLPMKILAFSPCFRREAGSYGKDTKGLIRVHEFFKWEQVVLCEARHEESVRLHEEILSYSEEFMQSLRIPYRVVVNCGGDLGLGQVKKYDIEAWVPSSNSYRETHSASYFHDFQSRRLNIRYKDTDGKRHFVHSLNNTAAAFPRLLVPLVENNQRADGSYDIPPVLEPYLP